jgi:hypothetical protein
LRDSPKDNGYETESAESRCTRSEVRQEACRCCRSQGKSKVAGHPQEVIGFGRSNGSHAQMNLRMIGWVVLSVVVAADPSQALELTNRDRVAHKLVVVEGQKRQELTIEPEQTLNGLCTADCSLFVGSDPESYELKVDDKLIIENAQVYYTEVPGQDGAVPENQPSDGQGPSEEGGNKLPPSQQ